MTPQTYKILRIPKALSDKNNNDKTEDVNNKSTTVSPSDSATRVLHTWLLYKNYKCLLKNKVLPRI